MSILKNDKPAYLLLADGTVFEGLSFGAQGTTIGEVVFATGMTGYQETLTDPSYYGQIVTQTFPLIGNYGTNDSDFESDRVYLSGYIVREYCEFPSNFRMKYGIDEFLKKQNVIAIYDIDTRALTRKIREFGVMNGAITTENVYEIKQELLKKINAFSIVDAVKAVSTQKSIEYKSEKQLYNVALFDFGYKHNIRQSLLKRGCNVTVVPYNTNAAQLKAMNLDGIMLSNGPGDPAENVDVIANLKDIAKLNIPMFGICLGHQLFALANNAKTEKLKYGHRGGNQPVLNTDTERTYVTTQNHGYAVLGETLDKSVGVVNYINANDKTCEGVRYLNTPAFTVQFHPEACAGPVDTEFLFDEFIALMKQHKGGKN
ncbi:MAG TPA: carbamoyl phosphate synthase small subunit [Ruminococcaceae bacterium]|nr:carbamoyl phosphate synthase small subunit [Oscillospiraceae bacterium]